MTKPQASFYESRYSQPYRASAWSQESQPQCLVRKQRTSWARTDLRLMSDSPAVPVKVRQIAKTKFRKVLRSSLEVGAFGTIFATFLSSLYMFG